METKRIIYVLPYEFYFTKSNYVIGGHTSHIIGVIEAFVEKGFTIYIVSDMKISGLNSKSIRYFCPCFQGIRKYLHSFKLKSEKLNIASQKDSLLYRKLYYEWTITALNFLVKKISKLLFYVGLFIITWREARKPNVDFIYARHNLMCFMPAIISKIAGVNFVLEVNTPASLATFNAAFQKNPKKSAYVRKREQIQYKIAKVVSVVSPFIGDWLIKNVNFLNSNKILINPNGVDLNRFNPAKTSPNIRDHYGIKKNTVLIGMVAVFMKENAVEDLIESFRLAQKQKSDIQLMLIGDSQQREELERYVYYRNLSNSVIFTGRIDFDRLPYYLTACDILASHFNYYGLLPHRCSIKHLEYMASGRPVVATDIGYTNFGIQHGINGLLIQQGDIKGFAKALIKLSNDPALRKRMGSQGRMDAEAYHSWKHNIERLLAHLYDNRKICSNFIKKKGTITHNPKYR